MNAEEQLRDILPPMTLPEEPAYMIMAGAALLVIFLAALIVWFLKFRKKKIIITPAHETALKELAGLRSLMDQNSASAYVQGLSAILRTYIENRFFIMASIKTTSEFFRELRENPTMLSLAIEQHSASLHVCLDKCDLVKFARLIPERQHMEEMESAVREFIEFTREDHKEEGKNALSSP